MEAAVQQTKEAKILPAVGRGVGSAWSGFVTLCKWCLRLTWNLFWLGMAAFTGICTLFVLFAFGAMLILVTQGYPLTGMVLLSFGAILCGGALTAGCYSLIRRKEKREAEIAEEDMAENEFEEVQYE